MVTYKSHQVHQKDAIVGIDPDSGGKPTGTAYHGALMCPDCEGGLRSGDTGGMVCYRLVLDVTPCHPGCLVACGRRDGTDG